MHYCIKSDSRPDCYLDVEVEGDELIENSPIVFYEWPRLFNQLDYTRKILSRVRVLVDDAHIKAVKVIELYEIE